MLKVLEGASRPSWSPDGTKLAFVQAGDHEWLHVIDTNFGPPRPLVGLGRTSQPPSWSRDGRWVMAVAHLERVAAVRGAEGPSSQTDLIRAQVDGGKYEPVANLASDPGGSGRWNGSWFSLDRAGEELFFTSDVEGQPSVIAWFRPRDRVTLKKDNPIDFAVRVVGLAVAPAGKVLALGAGASPPFAAPGLWNLATTTASDRFRAIVPDDATRVEWLTNLIAAARPPLGRLPAAVVGDRTAERPTLLPVPGEVPGNDEILTILRRLARTGRPLCDRPPDAPPAGPELLAFLDEARLFFDFAREDYAAALASLEAIEARTTSPEHRLRLLSARRRRCWARARPTARSRPSRSSRRSAAAHRGGSRSRRPARR